MGILMLHVDDMCVAERGSLFQKCTAEMGKGFEVGQPKERGEFLRT